LTRFVNARRASNNIGAAAPLIDVSRVPWLLGNHKYDRDWFSDALVAMDGSSRILGPRPRYEPHGQCHLLARNKELRRSEISKIDVRVSECSCGSSRMFA
jgi:hypothetical protein